MAVISTFKLLMLVWFTSSVCDGVKLSKIIHFIEESLTWRDAQQYCRKHYEDLITVLLEDEDAIIDAVGDSLESWMWIGARRDPENSTQWRWTEKSDDPVMNVYGEDCALIETGTRHTPLLYSDDCFVEHYFHCSKTKEVSNQRRSWYKAQEVCRENNQELSTVNKMNIDAFDDGWVGLHRDEDGIWKWTGESSEFLDWAEDNPRSRSDCGVYDLDYHYSFDHPCDRHMSFLCYETPLTLVRESKTWEGALRHCQSLTNDHFKFDLLSSKYDHSYATKHVLTAVTNEVWIGLRFLAGKWTWTDGANMNEQGLPICASESKLCGTRGKHNSNLELWNCMEKRNFLCFRTRIIYTTEANSLGEYGENDQNVSEKENYNEKDTYK